MQPLGSTAFLDIPGTFLLFLTDTICFPFSFPRKSLLLSERRARTLSFLHLGLCPVPTNLAICEIPPHTEECRYAICY